MGNVNTVEKIVGQYSSLTHLTMTESEEINDNVSFEEGVLGEKIAHYYPNMNSNVKGHGWTLYHGSDDSEYDMYIVCDVLPSNWNAYGCNQLDFEKIERSFRENPFLIEK